MNDRRKQDKPSRNRRTRIWPRRKHEVPFRILFINVRDLWTRFILRRSV